MKVSQKIEDMLEKRRKKKREREIAAAQAAAEAGMMPIGVPLSQDLEQNPYVTTNQEESKSVGAEQSEETESMRESDQIS